MRLTQSFLLGSFVMFSTLAPAQIYGGGPYGDPRRDDPYYGGRYGRYGRGTNSVIDRVRYDLSDAARANVYLDNHERKHFDTAQRELDKFEQRWTQGRFDTGPLDKAITSMQHLANSDQMSRRDRSMLARDLNALRDFRANRGSDGYGGYYDPYGRRSYPQYPYGR